MIQLAVPPVLSLFLALGSDFCFALASLQVKLKVPAQLDSAADSQVLFTAIPVFMVNFVALLSLSMNVLPFTSALMLAVWYSYSENLGISYKANIKFSRARSRLF